MTCSRSRRPSLDGTEQLRSRDSNMTTPKTHQVEASDIYGTYCKAVLNSNPSLYTVPVLFIFFTHTSRSPLAHFLSLSPVRGNTTTADLNSPVFLPSQTCQVTKSSVWVTLACRETTTSRQLVISSSSFHSTDEFLPLCWSQTWRSPCVGSDSNTGSERGGVEPLLTTTDGNVAADSD